MKKFSLRKHLSIIERIDKVKSRKAQILVTKVTGHKVSATEATLLMKEAFRQIQIEGN